MLAGARGSTTGTCRWWSRGAARRRPPVETSAPVSRPSPRTETPCPRLRGLDDARGRAWLDHRNLSVVEPGGGPPPPARRDLRTCEQTVTEDRDALPTVTGSRRR